MELRTVKLLLIPTKEQRQYFYDASYYSDCMYNEALNWNKALYQEEGRFYSKLDRTRVEIKVFIPHKGFVQKHRISSLVIRLEKEKAISNNTYMKEWRLEFVAIGNPEIDRIMQKGKDNYVMWIEAMKDIYRKMGKRYSGLVSRKEPRRNY